MTTLKPIPSLCAQEWVYPTQKNFQTIIRHSFTQEELYGVDSSHLSMEKMYTYARTVGSKNLRDLTFLEKARMLKNLALYFLERKEELYPLAKEMGASRVDAWIDIEGGIGTFFTYAGLLKKNFPEQKNHYENTIFPLSKEVSGPNTFVGRHLNVPKRGVAIHINAFNFPIWGMLEKLATCWSAGMSAIVKPASSSCQLTQKCVEMMLESNILPQGAIQLICGSIGNLLDFVDYQDVVTFTGSLETGKKIKNHPRVREQNLSFNMETDSLNATILEPTIQNSAISNYFVKEIIRELSVKSGQKCTAIRRIFVHESNIPFIKEILIKQVSELKLGDTSIKGVKIGPLINTDQVADVNRVIGELKKQGELWYAPNEINLITDTMPIKKEGFVGPHLFYFPDKKNSSVVHELEPFGPVCSIIPYSTIEDLSELVEKGRGSLVASIFATDNEWIKKVSLEIAPHHGRILIVNEECASLSTGHGSPLPNLKHGGPGRAGGGLELGGVHGLDIYFQKVAIQSSPTTIAALSGDYVKNQKTPNDPYDYKYIHPFRKYFEELEIGETLITHKRTITQADITQFAGISGDYFYAHTDELAAKNSIFEKRVAHGYFLLSAAAGLFVYPGVGPVIANYGLENLRFIKPVYPEDTIYVKLSVKEKMKKETQGEIINGVVVWDVEIKNQLEEIVATYLVLTLVALKNPIKKN